MGEHKHKAEGGEKKERLLQDKPTRAPATHPILQLQQIVGNRVVTNMIQRRKRLFRDDVLVGGSLFVVDDVVVTGNVKADKFIKSKK